MTTRSYRPSNGTEGEMFHEAFCYRCVHESEDNPCEILTRTFIHSIGEPEYPVEWIEDADVPYLERNPRCTAFEAEGDDPELAAARADKRQMGLPLSEEDVIAILRGL